MKNYYPSTETKSIIDQCILSIFAETYNSERKNLQELVNSKTILEQEENLIYESFNLKQLNQDFEIGNSKLFSETLLLFKDMYDIENSLFNLESNRNSSVFYPLATRFYQDMFDINQISVKMSFKDIIAFVHTMYKSDPESIYGVLLSTGNNKFFNPLHPLNAQAFVKKYSMDKHENEFITEMSKEIYTVIIYTYSNKNALKLDKEKHLFEDSLKPKFLTHLINVLATMDFQKKTYESIKDIQQLKDKNGIAIAYSNSYIDYSKLTYTYELQENKDTEYKGNVYLQPIQLINTGLAYPFYGITAVKYMPDAYPMGYQLSPMLSCNIGFPQTRIRKDNIIHVDGGSVCTGSLSNRSELGRKSLNHANLSSAFFSVVMSKSSLTFADVSVNLSLSIYSEFFKLDPIPLNINSAKKAPLSFQDFKKQNVNASLSDYLASLK